MLRDRDTAREKLVQTLEDRSRKQTEQLDRDISQNSQSVQDCKRLQTENDQLKQDMSWLANQAKQNKLQTDKAICDLQAYTQILRGMEKKLAETET